MKDSEPKPQVATSEMWRQKNEQTPFGRVELVASGTDVRYRFLTENAIDGLAKKIKGLNETFEDYMSSTEEFIAKFYPEDGPALNLLYRDYSDFLHSLAEENGWGEEEAGDLLRLTFDRFLAVPINSQMEGLPEQINVGNPSFYLEQFEEKDNDENYVIRTKTAGQIYQDFDRIRAQSSDPRLVDQLYDQYLQEKLADEAWEEFIPNFLKFARQKGINTNFDVVKMLFGEFLERMGFEPLGDTIKRAESLEGAGKSVADYKLSQYVDAKIGQLGKKNDWLKLAFGERKRRLDLFKKGLSAYFDMPNRYVAGVDRAFKPLQDYLILGRGKKGEEVVLSLDAGFDPVLDADPGKVSGDCTQGRPLPFERPEVPIYNAKIFDAAKKHQGNAYLLVTNAFGRKEKVWHFDAIQLPRLEIDPDDFIENLVQLAAREGASKNVDFITVNSEESTISNYDYIREAVMDYWKKHGERRLGIDLGVVPRLPKRYSNLQSDGDALILWSRK